MLNPFEAWLEYRRKRSLYWWRPAGGRINTGDELSRVLVAALLAQRGLELHRKRDRAHRLLAIGSVLHQARDGETVWGSGINGKIPADAHRFSRLDVRAVRGPRTREVLESRGIEVPEVYGDPALLMPLLFPRELLEPGPERDFVVVPHFNESPEAYARFSDRLVLPDTHPVDFVSQLLGARFVASSSLHGVILAEAYGIPAAYLDSGNGEDRFKYDDYYQGTGRMQWSSATEVEQCLEIRNPELQAGSLQRGLIDSFPYDLW